MTDPYAWSRLYINPGAWSIRVRVILQKRRSSGSDTEDPGPGTKKKPRRRSVSTSPECPASRNSLSDDDARHSTPSITTETEHGQSRTRSSSESHSASSDTDAPDPALGGHRPFLTLYSDRNSCATLLVTEFPTHTTRFLRRPASNSMHIGWRRSSANGILLPAALLPGSPLPPRLTPKTTTHACGICAAVKVHPVLCTCGHTFCYLCLRIQVQASWKCLTCEGIIRAPPVRNLDVEDLLGAIYPALAADQSQVTYLWDGLVFPTAPDLTPHVY
ncbi:hypothetical protein C8F01DRAFT_1264961 [Mycena amicta]|nr:hypothetical protein C8F01DRAFT_1264961 [Mycena amicta]